MAKGLIFSYCTLMSFKHKHNKYITTITKGKEDSWNVFVKGNKYHKEEINLQIQQYCTCEEIEEMICNKLLTRHIWDW
jgi:hypothetical protein